MLNKDRICHLLQQRMNGKSTPAEKEELEAILLDHAQDALVFEALQECMQEESAASFTARPDWDIHIQQVLDIDKGLPSRSPVRRLAPGIRWWAAAAIFLLLATGIYLYTRTPAQKELAGTGKMQHDVSPGGEKASLTLADGRQIQLDSAANGELALQGNARVVKLANGQLAYNATLPANGPSAASIGQPAAYNTLTTPRGGKYELTLPDGTRVWLNAASSLRYPTAFTGKERRVRITGEAWFEVAKNTAMPFTVDVDGREEVQVLGTQFNINAYEDEPGIHTTLLQGSVRINANHHVQLLQPGQQALVDNSGGAIKVATGVDLDQVIAWKKDLFRFDNADLRTVMRQLSRWYNVDVVYEKDAPASEVFFGEMQRSLNLSQVLKGLEGVGVHFRIEDNRKVIVTK